MQAAYWRMTFLININYNNQYAKEGVAVSLTRWLWEENVERESTQPLQPAGIPRHACSKTGWERSCITVRWMFTTMWDKNTVHLPGGLTRC